jgi:hypothetical protein
VYYSGSAGLVNWNKEVDGQFNNYDQSICGRQRESELRQPGYQRSGKKKHKSANINFRMELI